MNGFLNYFCRPLVLIGALNWGLVGAFNFNLVSVLFGVGLITRLVYILVGLSALFVIYATTTVQSESKKER